MKPLSETSKDAYVRTMLYGEAGTGKTTLGISFPGPILVMDFDGKLSGAADYWNSIKPEIIKEVFSEKFSMQFDSSKPYDQFQALLSKLEQEAKNGTFKFKTVILDSYTFYSKTMLGKSMSIPHHKRSVPGKGGLDDYAYIARQFLSDHGRMFDLPCNFIGIGHIKRVTDEQTGATTNSLLFDGQASSNYAPKLFQEVYRSFVKMENGKPVHFLQTRPDGKYECRTSMVDMPSIIPMSYSEIIKYKRKDK